MANTITSGAGASNFGPQSALTTDPNKYISLGQLIDPNKPDNRDLLINTYGDQGITGFLTLTGAVNNAGTADEVTWWEEGRLHRTITGTVAATDKLTTSDGLRKNDVLLGDKGQRLVVLLETSNTANNVAVLDGGTLDTTQTKFAIVGNIYGQGTDQPTKFTQPGIEKYTNPYIITKETYAVNGSQATNIGWVNVGNGDYRWYVKGEMDTRKRFMNQREMMLLFGQSVNDIRKGANPTLNDTADIFVPDGSSTVGVTGSEGYFQGVERRGIVSSLSGGAQGSFASMSDIDTIILELDKEGAPAEYAMYVNRATSLDIDDMLANGIATQVTAGLAGQFGAFNNDSDMAVNLGFKSFTRGGYTFHKHDWKLLNSDYQAGHTTYQGALIPLGTVVDPKNGGSNPSLEMNYKAAGNYSREMEHWVEGGGVLGYATNGDDLAKFHYRSECNLCVRAANQHVVLKGNNLTA